MQSIPEGAWIQAQRTYFFPEGAWIQAQRTYFFPKGAWNQADSSSSLSNYQMAYSDNQ